MDSETTCTAQLSKPSQLRNQVKPAANHDVIQVPMSPPVSSLDNVASRPEIQGSVVPETQYSTLNDTMKASDAQSHASLGPTSLAVINNFASVPNVQQSEPDMGHGFNVDMRYGFSVTRHKDLDVTQGFSYGAAPPSRPKGTNTTGLSGQRPSRLRLGSCRSSTDRVYNMETSH